MNGQTNYKNRRLDDQININNRSDDNERNRNGQRDFNHRKEGDNCFNNRREDDEWNNERVQNNFKNRRDDGGWNNERDENNFNNRRSDDEWKNRRDENNLNRRRDDDERNNGRGQKSFNNREESDEWNNERNRHNFNSRRDDDDWRNGGDKNNFNSRRDDDRNVERGQNSFTNGIDNHASKNYKFQNNFYNGRNDDDWKDGRGQNKFNNSRDDDDFEDPNHGDHGDRASNRNRRDDDHWIGKCQHDFGSSLEPSPLYINSSPPYESSSPPYDDMQTLKEVKIKGVGRGKDMTLPAWMTRCQEEARRGREVLSTVGGGRGRQRTIPAWMSKGKNHRNALSQPKSVGRGKERTKPAWLTRNDNETIRSNYSAKAPTNATDTGESSSDDEDDEENVKKNMQFFRNSSWKSLSGVLPGSLRGWDKKNSQDCSSKNIEDNRTRNNEINLIEGSDEEGEVADNKEESPGSSKRKLNLSYDEKNKVVKLDSSVIDERRMSGIGRGKAMTKPAWLTRQEKYEATEELRENTFLSHQDPSVSIQEGPGYECKLGGGRGKSMTIPAWMTKNDAGANTISSSKRKMDPTEHQGDYNVSIHSSGRRSVGMGLGMTRPAWMTRTEREETVDTTGATKDNLQFREHNIGRSIGRGRGRGRQLTTPSWMTKQQNTISEDEENCARATVRRSEETEEKVNLTKEDVKPKFTRGYSVPAENNNTRGRGRGRFMTQPAWMTSQTKKDEDEKNLGSNNPEGTSVKKTESQDYKRNAHPRMKPPERTRNAEQAQIAGNLRFIPRQRTKKTDAPVPGNPRFTPPPKKTR